MRNSKMQTGFYLISLVLLTAVTANGALAQSDSAPSFKFGNELLGPQGIDPTTTNAVHALEKVQQRADEHYQAERYDRAFNMYRKLAEYGDKFSQYRVAFMNHNGRGVNQDMNEAFAWSYLAAETADPAFVKYHLQIRNQLDAAALPQAKELAGKYLREYGMYAQASRTSGLLSREMRKCSGSRTGNTCNKVSSMGRNCSVAADTETPDGECLMLGMAGIPAIAGLQPVDLRKTQKNLAKLQDRYNPGRVELGELEVIEDEKD